MAKLFSFKRLGSHPSLGGQAVIRKLRYNVGNVFILFLIGAFAAAAFTAWQYVMRPFQDQAPVPSSRVHALAHERVEKILAMLDARLEAFQKPPAVPSRNPFTFGK